MRRRAPCAATSVWHQEAPLGHWYCPLCALLKTKWQHFIPTLHQREQHDITAEETDTLAMHAEVRNKFLFDIHQHESGCIRHALDCNSQRTKPYKRRKIPVRHIRSKCFHACSRISSDSRNVRSQGLQGFTRVYKPSCIVFDTALIWDLYFLHPQMFSNIKDCHFNPSSQCSIRNNVGDLRRVRQN